MWEEYQDLKGFDPTRMNDPIYVQLVKDMRQIKDNEMEVNRSMAHQQPKPQVQQQQQQVSNKQAQNTADFTMSDFIEQEKYDTSSQISKQFNKDTTGQSIPINSMWVNKALIKKYLSSKMEFKIKEKGSERFRSYRYHAIGDEELEKLRQMAEDLRVFYQLMAMEGNTMEIKDGKTIPVLRRNGKNFIQISKLETEYRRELAEMCLGISNEDFAQLEQWSNSEYTIMDIWGLNDILDSILERAALGTSYFRIASKT